MKIFHVAFLFSWTCHVMSAPTKNDVIEKDEEDVQKNTNSFMDDVIAMFIETYGDKLDPLIIPNQHVVFKKWFIAVRLYGEVSLLNARLDGLSKLHRSGDAVMDEDKKTKTLFTDVSFAVENLRLVGHMKMSVMGVNLESPVSLNVSAIGINTKACLHDSSPKPIIADLTVTNLDGVDISLPELGRASSLVDFAINGLIQIFRGSLKEVIQRHLLRFAHVAINKSNFRLN